VGGLDGGLERGLGVALVLLDEGGDGVAVLAADAGLLHVPVEPGGDGQGGAGVVVVLNHDALEGGDGLVGQVDGELGH